MNNRLSHILIFSVLLFGTALPQNSETIQANSPSPADSANTRPVITLERTLCYGACPGYELEINSSGLLVYRGKGFVKTKGEVRDTLSESQLDLLLNLFRDANYFTLKQRYKQQNSCGIRATDHPSVITSFRDRGQYEKIDHYLGCYQSTDENGHLVRSKADRQLVALEDSVDSIVKTTRWIR